METSTVIGCDWSILLLLLATRKEEGGLGRRLGHPINTDTFYGPRSAFINIV